MQSPQGTASEQSETASPDRYTPVDQEGNTMYQVFEGRMPRTTFNHQAMEGTISTIRKNIEVALILDGDAFRNRKDRATRVVFEPLEAVKKDFEQYFNDIEQYAAPAKYFEAQTVPAIKRIDMDKKNGRFRPEKYVRQVRKTLKGSIPINNYYVTHFDDLNTWLGQPLADLRDFTELLVLIVEEGNGPDPIVGITNLINESVSDSATQAKEVTTATALGHGPIGHGHDKTGTSATHSQRKAKNESSTGKAADNNAKSKTTATHGHPTIQKKSKVANDKGDNEFGFGKLKGWALDKKFDLGDDDKEAVTSKSSKSGLSYGDGKKTSSKPVNKGTNPMAANSHPLVQKYTFPPLTTPENEDPATEETDYITATNLAKVKADRAKNPEAPETLHEKELRMRADPATSKWKKQLADKYRIYNLYVHPREKAVYSKALNLACAAIKKGELCAKTIQQSQELAEERKGFYEAYEYAIEEAENEIMDEGSQ